MAATILSARAWVTFVILPAKASEVPAKLKKESWASLGVNVEKDFDPLYVVSSDKKKIVKELKDLLKNSAELIVATDEDREGRKHWMALSAAIGP